MSDEDLDELAQRYLDLWQDQVSALAADPAAGEALRRFVEAGVGGAMAAWTAWQGALAAEVLRTAQRPAGEDAGDGRARSGERERPTAGAPCGAAAAAAAPGGGGGDLDDVARRLAAVERRLAELERRLEPAVRDGNERDGGSDPPRRARRGAAGASARRRS